MASTHRTISDDVTGGATRPDDGGYDDDYSEGEYSIDEEEDYDEQDEGSPESEKEASQEREIYYTADVKSGGKKRSRPSSLDEVEPYSGSQKRMHQEEFPQSLNSDHASYRVLHRVNCGSSTHHIFKLWEDVPVRGAVGHLAGFEPLRHEQDYISKHPYLAFIVIKTHHCKPEESGSIWNDTASAGFLRSSHHFSDKGCIRIVSEELKRAMNEVAEAYIYGPGDEDMCPPYLWLYHHRDKLKSSARMEVNSSAASIRSLLEYINEQYGDLYARADEQQRERVVDKDTLPFLFRPNCLVVSRVQSSRALDSEPIMRAFVLQNWPYFQGECIRLNGWHYRHSSIQSTRTSRSMDLDIPRSRKTIRMMTSFPWEHASWTEQNDLITRGREYWSYRTTRNVCYDGWDEKEKILLSHARVVIDYRTYRQLHSNSAYWIDHAITKEHDSWPTTLEYTRSLTDMEYAMFPEILHAFLLKEKQWIAIRIEQISPIVWNSQAFERLVLPDNTKDLVKSLVLVRTTEMGRSKGLSIAGKRKDIIAGKGNGLIMLLHGAPGTGKTLTAGIVAEIAKKPLYNVTCGDIGTNPEEVEKYLKDVLFLGKTWNCILLLDEADVFLEERSLSDLSRNSLVSVFLRTLEYYDGILILTSNRVGTFDEAFSSRIQVSLHFPMLDRDSRRMIWKNFLDMLREDEEEVDYVNLSRRLDELSDIELNGRQIRNILTTARQLAMYKMVTLEWDHVQRAIKSVADFRRYIENVHGHTEEQNARDEKLR